MPFRERLLAIGEQGSGKTFSWLKIAENRPHARFHAIDPDDGVERVWRPEFPDVKNVTLYFTPTWYGKPEKTGDDIWTGGVQESWNAIQQNVLRSPSLEHWIVIEHAGLQWDMVQGEFTDQIFEKDIGKYFLERRKASTGKRLEAFEGWKDWPVMKKMYNDDYIVKACYRTPAHLFITTTYSTYDDSQLTQEAKNDPDISRFYQGTRVRIDGEKRLPFKVHTILLMNRKSEVKNKKLVNHWYMSTFQKDRGRRWLQHVPNNDFYVQYLVMVAGWSVDE